MPTPSDPIIMFVQGFLSQAAVYFGTAAILYFVLWRWARSAVRSARIQRRDRVNGRQLAFEVRHALVVLLMGGVTATVMAMLYASGQTGLTTDASSLGWPMIVGTFVLLLVFNDIWFYAWHRLLHSPWLFKHVHAVHHRSVDVNPFSSYSFHWFEGLVLGAWVLPVVVWVPMYLPMLSVMQVVGLANNMMSHLGHEFFPRIYIRIPLLRWTNTSTFHNLHHTSFTNNYGFMFRFCDRIFGTEHKDYETRFRDRGTGLNANNTERLLP